MDFTAFAVQDLIMLLLAGGAFGALVAAFPTAYGRAGAGAGLGFVITLMLWMGAPTGADAPELEGGFKTAYDIALAISDIGTWLALGGLFGFLLGMSANKKSAPPPSEARREMLLLSGALGAVGGAVAWLGAGIFFSFTADMTSADIPFVQTLLGFLDDAGLVKPQAGIAQLYALRGIMLIAIIAALVSGNLNMGRGAGRKALAQAALLGVAGVCVGAVVGLSLGTLDVWALLRFFRD